MARKGNGKPFCQHAGGHGKKHLSPPKILQLKAVILTWQPSEVVTSYMMSKVNKTVNMSLMDKEKQGKWEDGWSTIKSQLSRIKRFMAK